MSEASEPIRRAFDGAGKFEHGQRRRHVEASPKYQSRDRAFVFVGCVFGVDQPHDGAKCILGIGTPSFRHLRGGSKP